MNKTQFSTKWSQITKKYRCGSKILGSDRELIINSCLQTNTYKTNARKTDVKVVVRMIPIANQRKVRMICLESPGVRQPISKSKIIEMLYPTKKRKESRYLDEVRTAMRNLIAYQLSEFRQSLTFPRTCPVSLLTIKKQNKFDVDHYGKPFVQIADEFIVWKEIAYDDIKIEGPPTAKVFKDKKLEEDWKLFHKENANLQAVLPKYNRSKGCENYSSPFN